MCGGEGVIVQLWHVVPYNLQNLLLILASTEKKQQLMMRRRDTRMSFDESRDALKRFESIVTTPTQVFEEEDDDSQDDEGHYMYMHVHNYNAHVAE